MRVGSPLFQGGRASGLPDGRASGGGGHVLREDHADLRTMRTDMTGRPGSVPGGRLFRSSSFAEDCRAAVMCRNAIFLRIFYLRIFSVSYIEEWHVLTAEERSESASLVPESFSGSRISF